MSNIELKPCPFCGGEAKIIDSIPVGVKAVECCNWSCSIYVRTWWLETEEEAAEAWNRRAE